MHEKDTPVLSNVTIQGSSNAFKQIKNGPHVYKVEQQAHGGEQVYLAVIAQCFSQHPLNIPHNCNFLLSGQRVVDLAWSWTSLEMGRAHSAQ